jgi:acetylornithine deacetylase
MELEKLALTMLSIYSPSGEEAPICRFMKSYLSRYFEVKLQRVGARFNILACVGVPKIILATHLDTVPGKLRVRADEGYLYGRGACDAKGTAASMILAAIKAKNAGCKNFGVLLDVGEETDFSGVKRAIKSLKAEFVVLGEPTNMKVMLGQKGLLVFKVRSYGHSAHSSLDNPKSAISNLVDILGKVQRMKLPQTKKFGKTTLNIGTINGGSATNVVANKAEATVEFRTAVSNKRIVNYMKGFETSDTKIDILCSYDPVISLWKGELRTKNIILPCFTELFFYSRRAKAIVLGPGELKFAHTDKEQIKLKEMERAVAVYTRLLKRYSK